MLRLFTTLCYGACKSSKWICTVGKKLYLMYSSLFSSVTRMFPPSGLSSCVVTSPSISLSTEKNISRPHSSILLSLQARQWQLPSLLTMFTKKKEVVSYYVCFKVHYRVLYISTVSDKLWEHKSFTQIMHMAQSVLSNSSFVCIGYQNLVFNNMQTYLGNENIFLKQPKVYVYIHKFWSTYNNPTNLNVKHIEVLIIHTIHHKSNSIITCTSETYLIQMSEL